MKYFVRLRSSPRGESDISDTGMYGGLQFVWTRSRFVRARRNGDDGPGLSFFTLDPVLHTWIGPAVQI